MVKSLMENAGRAGGRPNKNSMNRGGPGAGSIALTGEKSKAPRSVKLRRSNFRTLPPPSHVRSSESKAHPRRREWPASGVRLARMG